MIQPPETAMVVGCGPALAASLYPAPAANNDPRSLANRSRRLIGFWSHSDRPATSSPENTVDHSVAGRV